MKNDFFMQAICTKGAKTLKKTAMKVEIKLCNHNGNSPIEKFNTISELKKYLNEVLYYSNEVFLFIEGAMHLDPIKYSECDNLRDIFTEARFYGGIVCMNVEF